MIFIIEIIVNLRNLVYINHSQMKNLWKGIELKEEQVKFLTLQRTLRQQICKTVLTILHYYQDNIDYRDKMVVTYRDIGFTIITQL